MFCNWSLAALSVTYPRSQLQFNKVMVVWILRPCVSNRVAPSSFVRLQMIAGTPGRSSSASWMQPRAWKQNLPPGCFSCPQMFTEPSVYWCQDVPGTPGVAETEWLHACWNDGFLIAISVHHVTWLLVVLRHNQTHTSSLCRATDNFAQVIMLEPDCWRLQQQSFCCTNVVSVVNDKKIDQLSLT